MGRDFFGRLRVRSRFFLGPMAEFTNPAMRMVSIAHGAGMVFTEMADGAKVLQGDSVTRKLVAAGRGRASGPRRQITAAEPENGLTRGKSPGGARVRRGGPETRGALSDGLCRKEWARRFCAIRTGWEISFAR